MFWTQYVVDLEDSEGKMSQMYKSMEMKQVEVERYLLYNLLEWIFFTTLRRKFAKYLLTSLTKLSNLNETYYFICHRPEKLLNVLIIHTYILF